MEGALSKWTNVMKGWQYRWFVLDDGAGIFSYYTSKDKMTRGVRRGCVRLRGALIGIDDEDDATFTITVDGKTFHFQAQDSQERERWIRALEDTVLKHNLTRRTSGFGRSKSALQSQGEPPSLLDFDKKLAETDSYLQMLLNQIAALKVKIDDPETSAEAKATYEEIAEKAVQMTESIKHGIVLLQIAKNASLPHGANLSTVDYVHHPSPITEEHSSPVSRPQRANTRVLAALEDTFTDLNVETGIELGAECQEKKSTTSTSLGSSPSHLKPIKSSSAIPTISYSSSEDEDFFDAEEDDDDEPVTAPEMKTPPPPATLDLEPLVLDTDHRFEQDIQSPMTPKEGREDINWDDLYSIEDEEDVDMKSHGSVITHLLSQVRIGMDLTKIVLPTFILERRSLLEMYSDFFAHPDFVVQVTEAKTPEERMVGVLKWYLSSFHAGRKSSIAKKPYNPILGETFRCHWKLGEEDCTGPTTPEHVALSNSGPLPWCSSDDLIFVAEQVSHHPPISAFYAEHVKKRVSVNAHIYTKSSFLGMSVRTQCTR